MRRRRRRRRRLGRDAARPEPRRANWRLASRLRARQARRAARLCELAVRETCSLWRTASSLCAAGRLAVCLAQGQSFSAWRARLPMCARACAQLQLRAPHKSKTNSHGSDDDDDGDDGIGNGFGAPNSLQRFCVAACAAHKSALLPPPQPQQPQPALLALTTNQDTAVDG